ncbi:MAG TPA: iron ABC transporter permease, partial [Ornithinicoccus sp.]|nr:iron ABC transporter permease [Ornithinicoccus sp.]
MTVARSGPRSATAVLLTLAALVPLAFLAVFFAWPVLGMLTRGFLPEGELDLSAVGEVLGRERTLRVLV